MSDPMVSAASVRHYGLFANRRRVENIAHARRLLNVPAPQNEPSDADSSSDGEPQSLAHPCPSCGGRMIIIETFERGCAPRYRPTVPSRIDSSGLLSPGHHTPMLFSCRLSPIKTRAYSASEQSGASAHSRGNDNFNSFMAPAGYATTISRGGSYPAVTTLTSQPAARGCKIPWLSRAVPAQPRRPAVSSPEAYQTPALGADPHCQEKGQASDNP
jgi:hypothetical protein